MQISSEYQEQLMNEGIDVEGRKIWLVGEISNSSYVQVAKGLSVMDKQVIQPVALMINSEGGDYYSSMGIVDLVRNSLFSVDTFVFGKAMSGALLILAAGKQRIASRYSWMLYHNSLYEEEGNHKDIKASVIQSEREEIQSAKFMASVTKKSSKFWKQIADTRDFYFTAEQALKLGVVDEIGS